MSMLLHLTQLGVGAHARAHTHTHARGRTPLNKLSARRRGRYLHNTTNTTEEHPFPLRDSNPRTQEYSSRIHSLKPHGHQDLPPLYHPNQHRTCNIERLNVESMPIRLVASPSLACPNYSTTVHYTFILSALNSPPH